MTSSILSTVLTSVVAFVGTNLDDILVLAVFFAQPTVRPRHIVAGQFLGFAALVLLSVLAASGALHFPRQWVGALGLVPLLMGARALVRIVRPRPEPDEDEEPARGNETPASPLARLVSPDVTKVALIAIGNGGDNIGVYVPLFASAGRGKMLVISVVFSLLLGLWCFLGYKLVHHPVIAMGAKRYVHVLTPFVFIALGLYIIGDSGLPAYLAERVTRMP